MLTVGISHLLLKLEFSENESSNFMMLLSWQKYLTR
jgi:hypothetical protein